MRGEDPTFPEADWVAAPVNKGDLVLIHGQVDTGPIRIPLFTKIFFQSRNKIGVPSRFWKVFGIFLSADSELRKSEFLVQTWTFSGFRIGNMDFQKIKLFSRIVFEIFRQFLGRNQEL